MQVAGHEQLIVTMGSIERITLEQKLFGLDALVRLGLVKVGYFGQSFCDLNGRNMATVYTIHQELQSDRLMAFDSKVWNSRHLLLKQKVDSHPCTSFEKVLFTCH